MEMFLDPDTITEISLQPVKRYGFDACILFSDILMIPYASGCDVSFKEGIGPQVKFNDKFNFKSHKLDSVIKGIENIKKVSNIPLIGFAGGPWTTLLYCLFDKQERSQINEDLINKNKKRIDDHIDELTDIISNYAIQQANAGIDAFQIFESAAEELGDEYFDRWCLEPTKEIISSIKSKTDTPIIGFPRRTTNEGYKKYSNIEKLDCISLDYDFDLDRINELNSDVVIQGNLNPTALLAENNILQDEVDKILIAFKDRAHIFNLGHGVLPNTSIKKVEELVKTIRAK